MKRILWILLSTTIIVSPVLCAPVTAENADNSTVYTDIDNPDDPVITAGFLICDKYITAAQLGATGTTTYDNIKVFLADYDNDGTVSSSDATWIQLNYT